MSNSPNSALIQRVQTLLTVDLHPSKLASVDSGVQEHLNGLLLRYNGDLEGVVLSYRDERVVSQQAIVHSYFPLTRLIVSATLVVFRPKIGARLVGVVNKLSDDFVGLVALGFINVVIKAPEVRSEFQPALSIGVGWTSKDNPEHTISVGDSVAFEIKEIAHAGSFLTLVGSLKGKGTGNVAVVGWGSRAAVEDRVEATGRKENKVKKKRKKEDERDEDAAATPEAVGLKVRNGSVAEAEDLAQLKKRRKEKDSGVEERNKKEKKKEKEKKGAKEKKKK